jgi:hypothetical protein
MKGARSMLLERLAVFLEMPMTVAYFAVGLAKKIAGRWCEKGEECERMETLTFADALGWFANCPADERITRGIMLKGPHRRGVIITWGYLDEKSQLISGEDEGRYVRRVIAGELDRELADYFGEHDLIILG